ncbi:permease [Pokkaliibacter plantistimulans]|uniref:permease n=1 Tax=Pokkaliibacter plantistimulans TaxID=1635171 RepID=UPI0026A06D64
MKHVVNILLLGMVLLGIAMMVDTPWGGGVALAPFVVWGGRFLLLIHRSVWAAIVFWAGIAYLSWQAATVLLISFLAVQTLKVVRQESVSRTSNSGRRKNRLKGDNEMQLSLDVSVRGGLGLGSGVGISDD